jgi:TolB-like protein
MVRYVLIGLVSMGMAALAAADPTTQPIPLDQIPVPLPRNAPQPPTPPPAAAPAAIPAGGKVVILPFEPIGDTQNRDWVGRAIQQNLAAEVARLGGWFPISAPAPVGPIDTAAARKAAVANGADLVVFGSFTLVGDMIQFNGQVLAANSDQALAGIKINGNFRDLFALEDELSAQLHRALRPTPSIAIIPAQQPQGAQTPVFGGGQLPDYTVAGNDSGYGYDAYPPEDDENDYSYPYVYYAYGPFGYGYHRHHDRDRDHSGGQWPNGSNPNSNGGDSPSGNGGMTRTFPTPGNVPMRIGPGPMAPTGPLVPYDRGFGMNPGIISPGIDHSGLSGPTGAGSPSGPAR